ncbi:MAG: protein phosphatase 2C domain-containing protein [Chromatiales bacterium]|nr:protein phosphatase 2C domain-containing protein [Chromatiales bacterium]
MATPETELARTQDVLAGARLYTGASSAEGDLFLTEAGEVAVSTVADTLKGLSNQDSAAVLPVAGQRLVLVVADGVGGQPGARGASNLAVQALGDALSEVTDPDTALRAPILDGIDEANRAVLGLGGGAATTLAVAEIGRDYIRSYHVGDSVILLCGQRGLVKLQTIPHSPVGFAIEAGLLDADDALHHHELNVISNVLGSPDMRIEVGSELPMAPRDTLLLASDGLFDNLRADEIVEVIRKGPLDRAISELTTRAQQRMLGQEAGQPSKPDDFTAMLFRRLPRRATG